MERRRVCEEKLAVENTEIKRRGETDADDLRVGQARCCAAFFMGNSLSVPEDRLIPFIVTNMSSFQEADF